MAECDGIGDGFVEDIMMEEVVSCPQLKAFSS
jgi:hypothetical protein